ncbi:MAG: NAD(+)/NADH kinase [Deltaproteobacteria bacterium]|nr:NAD(+)/NADH kinase [Deltaproteobacteria bacterium]
MNASAGTGGEEAEKREQLIREAFQAAGVEPVIHGIEPGRLGSTFEELARGADLIVAAGGDGTVSAIAGALAGGDVPLAVLPMGTLNHFAKDLGMPQELKAAAAAIVGGRIKRVDVGEVNGRVFINNSSVGLYPETVINRDRERARTGRGKWSAMALAAVRVLRRFPLLSACITLPERTFVAKTPLIFVGNNEYTINVLQLGERAELDRGQLSLYMMRCRGRLYMFWLMVRAIVGSLDAVRDFEAVTSSEVVVRLRQRHLQVAVDGEVVPMRSPLRYRIRPLALAVMFPATAEAT